MRIADAVLLGLLGFVFVMSLVGIVVGAFDVKAQIEIGRETERERQRHRANRAP